MTNRQTTFTTVMMVLIALLLVVNLVEADPPPGAVSGALLAPDTAYVNYQGLLTDPAGTPVADGSYSVVFALYNVASGGTALWTETQTVTTVNGLFNVHLGAVTALDPEHIDGRDLWLGVKVGADSEMTPRIPITSVFYARSLAPGAIVRGRAAHGNAAILLVENTRNQGYGLIVQSASGNAVEAEGDIHTDGDVRADNRVMAGNPSSASDAGDVVADDDLIADDDVYAYGSVFATDDVVAYDGVSAANDVNALTGSVTTGSPSSTFSDGDIVADDDLIADDDVIAHSSVFADDDVNALTGRVFTGNPTSTSDAGDIVADDDLIADDDVIAGGIVRTGTPSSNYITGDIVATRSLIADANVYAHRSVIADDDVIAGFLMYTGSPSTVMSRGDIVADDDLIADNRVMTGTPASASDAGDIVATDDLIADDNVIAVNNVRAYNRVFTGNPSSASSAGDIVATDDVIADDDVIAGDDVRAGGTKSAVIETASFGQRLTYAIEGAQVWLADQGQGQLWEGVATIKLDPIFMEMITVDERHPMLVQITLTSDARGVYVAEKTATGFTVRELQGGTSNATFDWQVSALRTGYEDTRLELLEEVEGLGALSQ